MRIYHGYILNLLQNFDIMINEETVMKKVCFVCLGNICRSPMAEFVMKQEASDKDWLIESRGTSDWEHGNPIHPGTQKILTANRIPFENSKASQELTIEDFETFDYLIGMDQQNVKDMKAMSNGRFDHKIALFCQGGVPDPWYTGDFEETYHLVSQGCQTWREIIEKNIQSNEK